MIRTSVWLVVTFSAVVSLSAQSGQTPIDHARELYYGAAYEEALTMLDGIAVTSPTDGAAVELYRAACLFALGRSSEAEQALENLVTLAPDTTPEQLNMTPWITSKFAEVRARLLSRVDRRQEGNQLRNGSAVSPAPAFYTVADPYVTRPVPLRENVPEPPTKRGVDFTATVTLQVDIAVDGSVERVTLEGSRRLPRSREALGGVEHQWAGVGGSVVRVTARNNRR